MMTQSDLFPPHTFTNFRLAVSTSMQLSVTVAKDFHQKFNMELSQAYGLIEVGLPFINTSQNPAKRESVGTILPDYSINIADPDAQGIGEVYIKGKGMFDAYVLPWMSINQVAPNGWFKTGDLGRLDQDGFLVLMDRKKRCYQFYRHENLSV